jgi:hypothetical protein
MPTRRSLLAAFSLVLSLAGGTHANSATPAERISLWNDAGSRQLTLSHAARLSAALHRPVRGVYVPRTALHQHDLGDESLLAQLTAAGLSVSGDLAPGLARVPAGTTLTMATSVARALPASLGAPGAQTVMRDGGDDECTGEESCAFITIEIDLVGAGLQCQGPSVFGVCLYWAMTPVFKYATTQTVEVLRTDDAVDTLAMSSIRFHDNHGNNWGGNFTVTTTNTGQPGAGASYAATSHGEWDMVGGISIPPGIGLSPKNTLSSGFCMQWTVKHPGHAAYSQLDGFQLNWELLFGVGTGGYFDDQAGYCTVS